MLLGGWFESSIGNGVLASFVAGGLTAVGALPIFVRTSWGKLSQALMLALAAGVMLGATVFSLVVPAIEIVRERTGSETQGVGVAAGGILVGAVAVWLIHAFVPHAHFVKGEEGSRVLGLGRNWLFILAITLHNFPEGMSVGIAYGADSAVGFPVALGIGLQNMPEGLAVAAALIADGFSRRRAFMIALLTGLVEPVGGLLGAVAVGLSDVILPWGLTFAGGAMLFVISGEIIPETHRDGTEHKATFALVVGFVVMMVMDVLLG